MRYSVQIAALIACSFMFISRVSHAEGSAWRCVDLPNTPPAEQQCQDAQINSIEDLTLAQWTSVSLPMPNIPYSCARVGPPPHQIGAPSAMTPSSDGATQSFNGGVAWTVTLLPSTLRSFLIGRHNASADLLTTILVSGQVRSASYSDQTINYNFDESDFNVMASGGGDTGVGDLDTVLFWTSAGEFWNGTVHAHVELLDGRFNCTVGYPGATINVSGLGAIDFDYPIPWTPANAAIAESIRNVFRRAVRLVVGVP
jgi:hypothetical protein